MKQKRRWFQFSLRFLLLVVFLLGPCCGWVSYECQRPRNAAFAAHELVTKGWYLSCEWKPDSRGASWWGRLIGIGPMPHHCVLRVKADAQCVSDEEMRLVAMLENVETLSLSGADISPTGMKHLAQVHGLQVLIVSQTRFGDAECAKMHLGQLKRLVARRSDITDEGIASLARNSSLQCMELDGTKITDVAMGHIGHISGLEQLSIARCRISDQGMRKISNLQRLEKVDCSWTDITEESLPVFYGLPKIMIIKAYDCPIRSEARWELIMAKGRTGAAVSFAIKEVEPYQPLK